MTGPAAPRRPGLPRPTFHRVTVAEAAYLTPRMRRIVLAGDDLAGYPGDGPGAHFKLVLPPPGQDEIRLPEFTDEGLRWPEGPRPLLRTYTPRVVDRAGRRLTVDFALHPDGGPASTWAVGAGDLAADAVPDADLPAGQGSFWVGLEAGAMRAVRTHLLTRRGAARDQLHTRAYRERGVANHPDHDTGDE